MSSLEDRVNRARVGNRDDRFRDDVLNLLERIAIALEALQNPPREVQLSPLTGEYPGAVEGIEPKERAPVFNRDAIVCRCGNDPWSACSQCTPARMAWFYNQHPGWRMPV
jgi:hypothetical protein